MDSAQDRLCIWCSLILRREIGKSGGLVLQRSSRKRSCSGKISYNNKICTVIYINVPADSR